jgi:hypothetical protein
MAQGVNNNAAAVGRSGESKQADGAATEIVLRAFGSLVCEAIEGVLDLVSLGRGEAHTWHVSGLDSFTVADVATLIEAAVGASTLDIRSRTFRVRLKQRVALQMLPDANQEDRDAIASEIEAGEADEAEGDPAAMLHTHKADEGDEGDEGDDKAEADEAGADDAEALAGEIGA